VEDSLVIALKGKLVSRIVAWSTKYSIIPYW
jgi:hypothetical protein